MDRIVSFHFISGACATQLGLGTARKEPSNLALMHSTLYLWQHQITLIVLSATPCPTSVTS